MKSFTKLNFYYIRLLRYVSIVLFIFNGLFFFYDQTITPLIFLIFNILSIVLINFSFKNINSISINLNLVFFLFGYNIYLPIMYIFKDLFIHPGGLSVGYFDFKSLSYIFPLSLSLGFLFLFIIFAWIFEYLLKKSPYILQAKSKIIENLKNKNTYSTKKSNYFLFILLTTINIIICYVMFINKIGITGITAELLPFKINGILFYYRYFVIPFIHFRISTLLSNKITSRLIIFIIFLLANFTALTSASKGVYFLNMIPVFIYLIKWKHYKILILSITFVFITVPLYQFYKNILYYYHYGLEEDSFNKDLFLYAPSYLFENFSLKDIFQSAFLSIGRALGIKELLMTIYNPIQVENPLIIFKEFYGLEFLDINKFSAVNLTGLNFKGKSFGIGLDLISYLYLSARNPFFFSVLIGLVSFEFVLREKLLVFIMKYLRINNLYIILAIHLLFIRFAHRLDPQFYKLFLIGIFLSLIRYLLVLPKNYKELD